MTREHINSYIESELNSLKKFKNSLYTKFPKLFNPPEDGYGTKYVFEIEVCNLHGDEFWQEDPNEEEIRAMMLDCLSYYGGSEGLEGFKLTLKNKSKI